MSFEKRAFMRKHGPAIQEYGREGCAYVHAETIDHECAIAISGEGFELLMICVRLIDRIAEQSGVSFDDSCALLKELCETTTEDYSNVRN